MVRRRNNIVLVKRDAPHKITLPNGRTFYAKFRRVTKEYLPGSTKIARTYKDLPVKVKHKKNKQPTYAATVKRLPKWLVQADLTQPIQRPRNLAAWLKRKRKRKKQKGKGISEVTKSVANSSHLQEVGKKLISKGINSIPSLFRRGTKKIKNKRLRQIAQSEIALDLVNKGTAKLHGGL